MSNLKNKNLYVKNIFIILVKKYANGSRKDFAKLIHEDYRWVLDKCSGKEGLPAEKLFGILKALGCKSLSEIDLKFDGKFLHLQSNSGRKPKSATSSKEKKAKPARVKKVKPVKPKEPKPARIKKVKPVKEIIAKPPKKRPMRRLKPKKSS